METLNEYKPKVSIIITCYNLEKFIKDAIGSLLAQRCNFNYEIIAIDDASSDGSRNILSGMTDERLHCIFLDKNVGAASAINIAFAKARGEYVCRFDGDDKWSPEYLQKAADVLDSHPEVALVHTDVAFIDENDKVTSAKNNIPRPSSLKKIDHEFESILARYYMNAPAIMARRSVWDKALPWPERFRTGLGDWYCSLLMVEKDVSCFIDEPLAYYRIHSTNMHRAMIKDGSGEKNTLWILDFFRKRNSSIGSKQWRWINYSQNRQLGFAYFAHDMHKDARRCLNRAILAMPGKLLDMPFLRIWLASMIGKKYYDRAKSYLLAGRVRQA